MVKSPKKKRRSTQRRKPASPREKRTDRSRKWVFLCVAGVLVAIGILLLMYYSSNDRPAKQVGRQPERPPTRPEPPAQAPKLEPEQEIEALKREEAELLQALIRDFPDNPFALEQMGNSLSRHGRKNEAVTYWHKSLAVDPDHFNAHRHLGTVALEKGQYEQALESYRAAARIRPEADGAHVKIGEALIGLGEYDQAIEQLQQELRIAPEAAAAHFLLGQAYLKQKAYEKAQSHYEKALSLIPDYVNAYYGLARVFVGLKQPDKAAECQAKFRALRDQQSQDTEDDREMSTADYLTATRSSVAEALLNAEELYRDSKDLGRSEALLRRAVVLDPNNIQCFERLGLLYYMTNRLPEAVHQFRRVGEIQPNNPNCYLSIASISSQLGEFDQAEGAYQKVIEIVPRESIGYRKLAQLYLGADTKLPDAMTLAKRAVDLEPSAEDFYVLGWACDVNGSRAEAAQAIERAIKLDPNNQLYRQVYERIKGRN